MQAISRSPLVRFIVIPLTFVGFLSGCTGWATVEPPWAEAIAEKQPNKVRVTLVDESRFEFHSPAVAADTLTGRLVAEADSVHAIPLSGVAQIERRKAKAGKTALLALGIFALGLLAMALSPTNGCLIYCGDG